ncbi:phage-related tail fiber protein [uncultured Mediterranean phage uvMED]|nr:phage-related tail fiber protein [uncultured Mediterranean phage uvMED]
MATLQGQQIKNSYKDLLQVSNSNSGVDGTLRNVEDGEGTVSALQLSSSAAKVAGNLTVTGNVVFNDGTTMSTAAGGGTDQSVKVSSNDTTAGFLNGKLVAGSNITLTEGSDGGNETLTIAAAGGGGGIASLSADTNATLGSNLDVATFDIVTESNNRNVEVAAHGTGKFVVRGNTNPGAIALNCENNSHAITLKSPVHSSGGNYELTLPTADGAGALVSNGSGTLSFNTQLGTIGGLSNSDGNFIVGTGSAFTVESGATARTSLGLGTMAVAATSDYLALAGGTMTGQLVAHSTGIQFSDGTSITTAPTSGISAGKSIALTMVFA